MPGTSTPLCQALGTTWWLELPTSLTATAHQAITTDIIHCITAFEANYSRFQATSFISQLNSTGELQHPSPECVAALEYGQTLYSKTDSLFNMLIGTHLVKRRYDNNYSLTPTPEPTQLPNPLTDLQISAEKITLRNGAVDMGGYGKGYLIDQLADRLAGQHELSHFLINGGGDMYAKTLPDSPVTIYLAHPTETNLAVASTTLQNEAFAASSPHLRSWTHRGKDYNHLVQTHTDAPTKLVDGVFIKADQAASADALATTLLLLNPADITAFCSSRQLAAAWYDVATAKLTATPTFLPLQRL